MSGKPLGQVNYEAYVAEGTAAMRGRSSISGDLLPSWDDQHPEIRARWEAGAQAVLAADQMSRSRENKPPS